jgi:hypothetical protein
MGIPKRKASSNKELALPPNNDNPSTNYDATNLSDYLFDANSITPDDNILVSIQGKNILSEGNILTISGKPKSRKSVIAHSILSSAIANVPVLGIECNLPNNAEVVLIDTEQSTNDLSRSLQRLKQMAHLESFPNKLKVYTFRTLNSEKIKIAIPKILTDNPNVRLLIIDGGLDLISNMNDIVEVKETIDWFKSLLVNFSVGIVTIVHQSKSSNFTIGHLGSFLDRFSQSVIEVSKLENGNSQIKSQYMRSDSDFSNYEFYFNHNINAYAINWNESDSITKNNIDDYSPDQHYNNLQNLYIGRSFYIYNDLFKAIAKKYQKSEKWAKDLIVHLYELELIVKTENGIILNDNCPF